MAITFGCCPGGGYCSPIPGMGTGYPDAVVAIVGEVEEPP